MSRVGVVRFLGTNCDRDIWQAVKAAGKIPQWLWYQDQYDLSGLSAIILPGGFSYGDYLRCGALAAKTPVMKTVKEAGERGMPILGICNGFQILCDFGLLPGALVQNTGRRFIDRWIQLNPVNRSEFWGKKNGASSLNLPIAHGEGRFYIEEDGLKRIQDQEQIWWTYESNPNGSVGDIAGVMNEKKNVAALMPHPERALFHWMGGEDGLDFFA